MRFTWREPKRRANLKNTGWISPTLSRSSGSAFTFEDNREDYGEQRWVTLGLLGEQVMVIVYTETEDEIHVISMPKADKDEQILFFTNF